VSPRGGDPNATSRGERFAPMRARIGGKGKQAAFSPGQNHQERHQSYPKTGGSCAIYVPKNDVFFAIFWQFATLLGPGKRAPPSPPKKSFFLSFPKET